ncbi:putative bifunctional inhibitor/plant lipid transfer protein/seed storage helical [Helianthus annuus]|nr:putative bifunctional inhibitor/plant lipid transfer protein/seed storage helical [Helianthus annuus]KAJ0542883.1 putative bifunctional inhibitor/plant lipid transfer protein/seed storage helical [Helianthus annuus]KAJ0707939.1 putative bifunctional inhibitor/plant lipid transfer protein/seed storage helical [Helianthus annuus]KAJ0711912.1 putative bifunctional inhibitor/plant lipid transfer protein/seed storage helical [Helianthus annuus]KAJ0888838.1 putative bifunctional inhibitor/plant li
MEEKTSPYIGLRLFTVAVIVMLLSAGHQQVTGSQITCDPVQLSWCLQSIVSYLPPTEECCQKLKAQEPCLCQETSDPTFGGYLLLPGAQPVCAACNVTYPYCH